MSVALSKVRADVQILLRDIDHTDAWFSPMLYDQMIAMILIRHWARSAMPQLAIANAFSINADGTFELPTTREYTGLVRIQLAATALFLTPWTTEQMDMARSAVLPTTFTGLPTAFAIYEQRDSKVEGRVWAPPGTATLCNLFIGLAPDDIRTAAMDTVTVDMSIEGVQSLVMDVAHELASGSTGSKLEARGLSQAILPKWQSESYRLRILDNARRHNMRSTGRIARVHA